MEINEKIIKNLIEKIKQNKKYKHISDLIVKKEILLYLKSSQIKINERLLKKQEIKSLIKNIRTKLHRIYASYQTKDKRKREFYLEELKKIIIQPENKKNKKIEQNHPKKELFSPSLEITNNKKIKNNLDRLSNSLEPEHLSQKKEQKSSYLHLYHNILKITNTLLSTNISTKERLNDYQYIYNEIFKITGKPETITDLGCGLNPLSFPYINLEKSEISHKLKKEISALNYYAYDIDNEDVKFINDYFEIMKKLELRGKAKILDITDINNFNRITRSDIVFMFKLVDLIDEKSRRKKKISEEIITFLLKNKTRFVVVSFATKTLSQKSMKLPIRRGFELMLLRNNLKFDTFSTSNEVFYVIWTSSK